YTYLVSSVTATTSSDTLSLHDALPISLNTGNMVTTNDKLTFGNGLDVITDFKPGEVGETDTLALQATSQLTSGFGVQPNALNARSEEHTSELQSRENLVCRLLLEKKKK